MAQLGVRLLRSKVCIPLLALCFSHSFAGCGRTESAGRIEIVYWTGWSGHEYDAQKELIREFNRMHPRIRVRMLTQFNTTGSYQKVRIALAGGATPDVMSTVWPHELAAYALRGVLEPLDAYFARSGRNLEREFVPGVARMVRIEGRIYGLCVTTNATFIAYNKQAFRRAGLDPERPPRTTDELDAAARACVAYAPDGRLERYGFRPRQFDLWAYAFGGRWYDEKSGRVTANDPANIAALRWMAGYRNIVDIRRIQSFDQTFGGNQSANGPFYSGRMAMWQTGEWAQEFIQRYAPDLEWGWFPLPSPPGGRPQVTGAGGSVFVIPAASRHKEAAWEFLSWISGQQPVSRFCAAIRNVPALIAAGQTPLFQTDPLFRFAVRLSRGENAFGPPVTPIWPVYRRELQRVEEAAVLGGEDPAALLSSLQTRMEREETRTLQELGR